MTLKTRTFQLSETQRRLAERELVYLLDALGVDSQWGVRRCCWLLEVLSLPNRLKRPEQLKELENRLALHREGAAQRFGRPWTERQLVRAFYAKSRSFRRPTPHPVTREELTLWTPRIPGNAAKRPRNQFETKLGKTQTKPRGNP